MSKNKQKLKSVISLLGAIFFLVVCSLMFFPWFKWEEQESVMGTVQTLTISQSKYGSTPSYTVLLDNGKTIRVKAPPLSNFEKGDPVEIRLFTDRRNKNLQRYAVKWQPSDN